MIFNSLRTKAKNFLDGYKQKGPASFAAAQQAIGGLLILDGLTGIDNPFGGKKRPGIFGTLGGIVVGIVFILVPTVFGGLIGLNKMTATTQATVVMVGQPQTSSSSNNNTSSTCSITAKYTVEGKEYTKQSSINSSSICGLAVGSTLTINYDPSNPNNWSNDVKTMRLIMKIFFWAGILAVISSFVTFAIRLASIVFGWKLLRSGRKLAATLPAGTNLSTIVDEVKKNFVGNVFNFGGGAQPAAATPPKNSETPPKV